MYVAPAMARGADSPYADSPYANSPYADSPYSDFLGETAYAPGPSEYVDLLDEEFGDQNRGRK